MGNGKMRERNRASIVKFEYYEQYEFKRAGDAGATLNPGMPRVRACELDDMYKCSMGGDSTCMCSARGCKNCWAMAAGDLAGRVWGGSVEGRKCRWNAEVGGGGGGGGETAA